jgi:hypothetical protein
MAEAILSASRVVADIGQGIPARMAQHVGVDRKGKAGPLADALDEPVDRVGRERPAAQWRRRRLSPDCRRNSRSAPTSSPAQRMNARLGARCTRLPIVGPLQVAQISAAGSKLRG